MTADPDHSDPNSTPTSSPSDAANIRADLLCLLLLLCSLLIAVPFIVPWSDSGIDLLGHLAIPVLFVIGVVILHAINCWGPCRSTESSITTIIWMFWHLVIVSAVVALAFVVDRRISSNDWPENRWAFPVFAAIAIISILAISSSTTRRRITTAPEPSTNSRGKVADISHSYGGLLIVAVVFSAMLLVPASLFVEKLPDSVLEGDSQNLVHYLWFPAVAIVAVLFIYALIPVIKDGRIVSVASIIGVAALGLSVYIAYTYSFDSVAEGRALITIFLVLGSVSLAVIISLSAVLANYSKDTQSLDKRLDVAKSVFATLVGVLGTVVGFYFGTGEKAGGELKIVDIQPHTISAEDTEISLRVTTENGDLPLKYLIKLVDSKGTVVDEHKGLASERTFVRSITRKANEVVGLAITVRDKENKEEDEFRLSPGEWIEKAKADDTRKDDAKSDEGMD